MTDKILLTIGIPVYNGAEAIGKTLGSLAPQLSAAGADGIEVLVCDNASADGTPEAARGFAARQNMRVSVWENKTNLGYDGNLEVIAARAAGRYVWFLGCGEVVLPGVLARVAEKLKGRDYDNVVLNFEIEAEKEPGRKQASGALLAEETEFSSGDDFLRRTGFAITPLSANIVARAAWARAAGRPLASDGWAHVERILHILLDRGYKSSLFLPFPAFTLFRESAGWWSRDGLLYRNSLRLLAVVAGLREEGLSAETRAYLLEEAYRGLLRALAVSKFRGLRVTAGLLREAAAACGKKSSFWFLHLPLLLLPAVFLDNPAGRALYSALRTARRVK